MLEFENFDVYSCVLMKWQTMWQLIWVQRFSTASSILLVLPTRPLSRWFTTLLHCGSSSYIKGHRHGEPSRCLLLILCLTLYWCYDTRKLGALNTSLLAATTKSKIKEHHRIFPLDAVDQDNIITLEEWQSKLLEEFEDIESIAKDKVIICCNHNEQRIA